MQQMITGCNDCPLKRDTINSIYERATCTHTEAPRLLIGTKEGPFGSIKLITPDWCPIKKEPLTITFKEN